ncbi:MAG TPA: dihydroorotase, partial [Chitinophagales bacterium]|nr:dihydroorotase [Chitinophagales bacterium]
MKKTLIKNAQIVNEGKIYSGDLLLKNGRIEKIDGQINGNGSETEINAEGCYLFPGIIDDQVHFREPGLTHKATIYSESKAGIAGGVTSFMEMPNTIPPADTHELLEQKYRTAQVTSLANYSFYLGTSNTNLEEIKKTDPSKICGIKIFMGSSTGKLVVDDQSALENIFRHAPTLIATHCETDPLIKLNENHLRAKYGDAIPMELHPIIRNEEQCFASSRMAVILAQKYDARLHILHISTAEELALFSNKLSLADKKITAEVCVHHLWFDSTDYEKLGPQIKCNPAIKNERHKKELLKALLDNRLDVIATDHAPHLWEEKYSMTPEGKINYFKSPSGLPLLQHAFSMMLEFYRQGKISLEKIAEKMSHAPATLFGVKNRGFIREGYAADLFLLDLKES